MRKIPTVWMRDTERRQFVVPTVAPGNEWVLDGEGIAQRKVDGTCVMFDGLLWWARREYKPKHQVEPRTFVEIEHDPKSGKSFGWVEAEHSSFARFLVEAVTGPLPEGEIEWRPGTYELCGPKINGNHEELERHTLLRHDSLPTIHLTADMRTFEVMQEYVRYLKQDKGWEGLVFKHADGRMAKIKWKDYPR